MFTATVTASGTSSVWEQTIDKYSFIPNREEYTWDIQQDAYDANRNKLEDTVYVIFNTPPYSVKNEAIFTYGVINPLIKFESMQPIRDNEPNFYLSAFGFTQWLNPNARIRT